jgi:hypothetical protein
MTGSFRQRTVRRPRDASRRRGIPDTHAPGFAEEARRQCHVINAAEATEQSIEWVESVGVFDEDDTPASDTTG